MKKIVAVSLTVLGLVAQANAATVTRDSGSVSLSSGSRYVPVKGSTAAAPGDLVRTGKKSHAVITLDCGDRFDVGPGKVMRVPAEACAATAAAPVAEPAGVGLGSPMVLAAGAAAAVGVGAAAAATNGFSSGSNGPSAAEQLAIINALTPKPVSP